jgi:hypothetical protein
VTTKQAWNSNREPSKVLSLTVRPETKELLGKLCEVYHLSQSAIVTTAIVELYNARLGPQEKKKRGNGHP